MSVREATVAAADGLHARPAAEFVKAAKAQGVTVMISKGEAKPVKAASMLGVLGLGARQGDVVTLQCDEEGAEEALDTLVALIESGDR